MAIPVDYVRQHLINLKAEIDALGPKIEEAYSKFEAAGWLAGRLTGRWKRYNDLVAEEKLLLAERASLVAGDASSPQALTDRLEELLKEQLKPVTEQLNEHLKPVIEQLKEELKSVKEGLQSMQAMMASQIEPIWETSTVASKSSNASSGAKRARVTRDAAIKIRLSSKCGYTDQNCAFLQCQLTGIVAGSPVVRGAHIFPYAKANMMVHMLGCSDVNATGNMALLLAPVERALDRLFFTFVLRRGRLVARWLNPTLRNCKIIDSCTDIYERGLLQHLLNDLTWGSLEGKELQKPGTWQPLLRAFALHSAYSMAEAERQDWLLDAEYLKFCEDGDSHSYQSADTPAAAVALWAAAAAAADPPTLDMGWTTPDLSHVLMRDACTASDGV